MVMIVHHGSRLSMSRNRATIKTLESTIPLNEIVSQIPPSIVITTSPPVLPIKDLEDSLIMGNEELSTIPEKESNEFIKASVEDLVLILSESKDTSGSDSEYDLSSCDDFSPINIPKGKSVTFSNPLFNSNDDFTFSDDESLSDEDVLEDIECKVSYDSNLDEPELLVTPLSNANEDECFDPGDDVDEIELLLHRDLSTPKMSVASILEGFTNEPPLEENDDLFDLESKENKWKKILYDAPIDDLMTEDKVFDPEIQEKKIFSNISEIRLVDHGRLAYRCDSRLKGGGNNNYNNKSETDKSLRDYGRLAYRGESLQKGQGSPGRNKTAGPWLARIPMWQLFKGP
nr:hypothetical protein [Tanacetum cinerariifolium]